MSDLNTRARDALRGEWLPGMRSIRRDGRVGRLYRWADTLRWEREDGIGEYDAPLDAYPDLDDPVTELALITVLERRVGKRVDVTHYRESVEISWDSDEIAGHGRAIHAGPTRGEALVAALEAAATVR